MINFEWLLCSVIKFHVVKKAKEAVLYFVHDFWSYVQFNVQLNVLIYIYKSTTVHISRT